MVGKRRLTKATLGVVLDTGLAAIVPAGQVIEIAITPLHGERTVDVFWDGKKLMMFVNDLKDRSQEIKP